MYKCSLSGKEHATVHKNLMKILDKVEYQTQNVTPTNFY